MDLVYESDVVNFYVEARGPKLYLHTEVKVWSKSALKHGIAVIQELGAKLGELFTYSPTPEARKLACIAGFRPTHCTIPAHYDANQQVAEFRLERFFGEHDELVALGKKAHEHEALAHSSEDAGHDSDAHDFAVGLLVKRVQSGHSAYAQDEYNRWASQNGYVTVTVEGYNVTFNETTVEVPTCL